VFASLEELKDFLGLGSVESAENQLLLCLNAADSFIKTFTNRFLISTRFNHNITPQNSYEIWVPEFPLTALHGMTAFQFMSDTAGSAIDLNYTRFLRSGLVYSSEGFFITSVPGSVLVDYTAGYSSTDPEFETLKWITLETAGQFFRGRGLMNIVSYQAGGAQVQKYDVKITDVGAAIGILGPEIAAALGTFAVRGPRSIDR